MGDRKRALVVDDHELALIALSSKLRDGGFDVVATAATCDEGVAAALQYTPDVLVVDYRLGNDETGLDLVAVVPQELRQRTVLVSSNAEAGVAAAAIAAGVGGYVLKTTEGPRLLSVVRHVAAGNPVDVAHFDAVAVP